MNIRQWLLKRLLNNKEYLAFKRWEMLEIQRKEIEQQLHFLGFDIDGLYTNPFNGIGAALQIAKELNITLHRGTCYGDCRAELKREHWQYFPRLDIADTIINPWLQRQRTIQDVTEICTWGLTPEIAVGRMLVSARRAGVI